ncbi:hypothetical protein [Actinoplanes sp. NPDC048796]|uniref:hypothetical protein n=1 Tax=unclassified Actinoplanes TaxID=2626549 RepID=UPI0033DB726C
MSSTIEDQSGPNDGYELELARLRERLERTERELAQLRDRPGRPRLVFQFTHHLLQGARVALWIVCVWLPLTALQPIAHDLAGKDIRFDALNIVLLLLCLGLTTGWAITGKQSRERKKKIQELRVRHDRLEVKIFQQRADPEG